VADATLPPSLRLTILRRISFLPDESLRTLRAASILGSSFTLTDLAAVATLRSRGVGRAGRGCQGAGAGRRRNRLRFRHDLIRDAIYEDLPGSVRSGLHREAGQRLARSGAPALLVAEHLARGARTADAEAIGWLTRAARSRAHRPMCRGSPERAMGLMGPPMPYATGCSLKGPAA
jgi:hypothetical protein